MKNFRRYKKYINTRGLILTIMALLISGFLFGQTNNSDSIQIVTKRNLTKNITFGSQPAGILTGAISGVNGDELLKSFTPNIANTLYGRIMGLTVMQGSGEPGMDSPGLYARGVNTFGPGRSPLIIIDGFPSSESSFEQLSPYEIESISLLKDAAASTIFGNRAANGVLMISTKRGHNGPLKVSFTAQYGVQDAMRLPEFLGSYDYANLYNEALVNDGKPPLYTASDLDAYRSGKDPVFHPDVNWYNELLRNYAPASNYDLSLSGGNETIQYFVLLNILNRRGLYINTGDLSQFSKNFNYTRYNFRTNMDIQLSKRLSSTIFIGGSVEDRTNPGVNESAASEFDLMASVPPNAFPVYVKDNLLGGSQLYSNPLGDILQRGYYSSNGRNSQIALKLTEQLDMITPGLSISAAVAFNSFFKNYSIKTREYARYSVSKDDIGNPVLTKIGQETALSGDEGRSSQWRNTVVQSFLNYSHKFGIHSIDAMLMYNYDDYIISGSNLPYKNIGGAGRFTYSMSDKYIGEFSFGYNGSENFSKGKRFGFFPAVSLGWVMSNEDFLKENAVFNYLKIKGSYGLTGNNEIGGARFMFDQYYNWGASYYFGTTNNSVGTINEGQLANPDVTWEKDKKLNIGIETTMFKHFDVTLDLFNNDRYDILALPYRDVPQYLGVSLPTLNVGKVNNKGIEAVVRYSGKPTNSLQYFVEGSIWYAKNKIVYNSEAVQPYDYLYRTGWPVDQPFLLEAIGFFKDNADIETSPKQIFTDVQPGDIKYKDQNGDKIIDQNDYVPLGRPNLPELTYGLHAGLNFRGFDLDAFFQGVADRSIYLSGNYFYAFQNYGKISSIALGRWTPETAATATYPRLSASDNLNNFQPSSFWQRNGSFIKLRDLEVGYTLPEKFSEKAQLSKVRVFLNGTNLFSIDHMNGFTDPETLTGYPTLRVISMGVNIQL